MADDTTQPEELDQPKEDQDPLDTPTEDDYSEDERKRMGEEVDRKYSAWRSPRKPFELQWFVTAAYRHGKHTAEVRQTFSNMGKMDNKKKNIANKLWAKCRARFAKFVKTRPKAIVVPFTHDRKGRLNARMTEKALDYLYEKTDQEVKYADAILWCQDTGKSYWWIHWNPLKMAAVKSIDKVTKTESIHDVEAGDVEIEVGSLFEVLFPDLRQTHIGDQPEVMRVRVQHIDEVKARYEEWADKIKADAHLGTPFEFERQIAHLAGSESGTLAGMVTDLTGPHKGVLVKELYQKPTAKWPKGRMIVACNGFAVKMQDELPHRFWDLPNPYPCVEFIDMPQVGQAYPTTFTEQLIPLQRGYNMLRDKLETQIRMNVHPKWMVTRQARIPKGALTNESAEIVEWNYIPGMPEPHPVTPGSIVADAWRFAQLLEKEFDDLSQIYPSAEGKAGSAKSGFQTNLLQEASDSVHSPDARGFELAIKDAAYKFRRLMKDGYDVPRLMSFAGRSSVPEVFEFSQDNIDEHAVIRVQIGSGLSQFKAARVQQLLEFHEKGLLGDPNDPEVKRRVLSLVDLGGVEEFQERAARDEDMAQMENLDILSGSEIPIPQFYEDHLVHYGVHTDELKNPANKNLEDSLKKRLIAHVLLHMKWINPAAAYNLAKETGLDSLLQPGLIAGPPPGQPPPPSGPAPRGMPTAAPTPPGPGGPAQPGGAPPAGTPPHQGPSGPVRK